jgi:hypothetical protein
METGTGSRERALARIRERQAIFSFPFSIFALTVCLIGCASPGEPIERKPPVPAPVSDLSAEQSGNAVVLTFTLPRETVDRRVLKEPPDIQIYREVTGRNPAGAASSPPASPSLLLTIPSAMVAHYSEQGHIRYRDVLQPQDFSQQPNEMAMYMVRTRASQKKSSPDSNVAGVRIYPAPEPIEDLKAEIAHSTVQLSWTAPQKTPIGPAPPIKDYRLYRAAIRSAGAKEQAGAVRPESSNAAATTGFPPQVKPQLMKFAETDTPSYEDSQVEYDKTYIYAVRSVVDYSGAELESGDSNLATITVRDVIPPSTPQGIVVVFVPSEGHTPAHLELSWSINPETDVAGYNVYRTEEQGTLGARVNAELLPAPTYSDKSVIAGHRYFYSVTAVDRSGNESAPSAAAAGEVPAENHLQP